VLALITRLLVLLEEESAGPLQVHETEKWWDIWRLKQGSVKYAWRAVQGRYSCPWAVRVRYDVADMQVIPLSAFSAPSSLLPLPPFLHRYLQQLRPQVRHQGLIVLQVQGKEDAGQGGRKGGMLWQLRRFALRKEGGVQWV